MEAIFERKASKFQLVYNIILDQRPPAVRVSFPTFFGVKFSYFGAYHDTIFILHHPLFCRLFTFTEEDEILLV